jgi:hypothetical protein
MFPVDDVIAIDLLRLMSGCNDIYFLQEWATRTKQIPRSHIAPIAAAGRNALQLRLLYSFLHESLSVIRDLKERPQFQKLRSSISDEGKQALDALLAVELKRKPTDRDWKTNESILRARHTATFHYDSEKVKEALNRWLTNHGTNEEAYIVRQEKTGLFGEWSYYSVADMVRSEIVFGIRNPNHQSNVREAITLMKHLGTFTHSLFIAYIKDRRLQRYFRPTSTLPQS